MLANKKICFIGAGAIAEAMISGLLSKGIVSAKNICVINKSNVNRIEYITKKYGINNLSDKGRMVSEADLLILSVKPIDVTDTLKQYKFYTNSKQLFISVVAGVTTAFISQILEHNGPVIRSMPNTSSMVGLSATALALGQYATDQDLIITRQILEGIGKVTVIDEYLLDAVTGLSGSGPAYFYYLAEAMEASAVKLGIKKETARELIIQTMLGAGHMLLETNEEPEILRKKVTSPGGTTMAGIEALEKFQFTKAIEQAIFSATERSKQLGEQFVNIK